MLASWKRLALAATSASVALVVAEGIARWSKPAPYGPIVSMLPSGDEIPISEIVHFLRRANGEGVSGAIPRAWAPANLDIKIRYDRPRWPYFDAQGCIRVTHDSLGFRDDEIAVEKPRGQLRILTIGDSFTYGIGVPNDDAWPQVLERRIEEERGGDVQVVNGGFATTAPTPGGYAPWLRAEGVRFDPDVVIIGFCLNDFSHDVPMLSYPTVDRDDFDGPSELVNAFRWWRAQRAVRAAERDYADVVDADPSVWDATRRGLREMRDLLAERGVPLVVAVFPMLSGLDGAYPYQTLHERIDAFCADEGIACVDLLPRFRGLVDRDLWVHPLDQHPNPRGHRLIAEGVFEFLAAQEMLR